MKHAKMERDIADSSDYYVNDTKMCVHVCKENF